MFTKCISDTDQSSEFKCKNGKCFNQKYFQDESFSSTQNFTNICEQASNYSEGFIGWHKPSFPSQDFWNKVVLKKSESIENTGEIVWQLVLLLLASWIIVFVLTFKGIKGNIRSYTHAHLLIDK